MIRPVLIPILEDICLDLVISADLLYVPVVLNVNLDIGKEVSARIKMVILL